jgi:hypothetical protein
LVDQLAGKAVAQTICKQIIERAEGVPLFIEEPTRVLGNAATANSAVVVTLYSSLIARLDGMPDTKLVAQVGAVIGREFPYELIAAVPELSEPPVQRGRGSWWTRACSFAAARHRMRSIRSSTRSCGMPPTRPCCERADSPCMVQSPQN